MNTLQEFRTKGRDTSKFNFGRRVISYVDSEGQPIEFKISQVGATTEGLKTKVKKLPFASVKLNYHDVAGEGTKPNNSETVDSMINNHFAALSSKQIDYPLTIEKEITKEGKKVMIEVLNIEQIVCTKIDNYLDFITG